MLGDIEILELDYSESKETITSTVKMEEKLVVV